ncbi:MAG: hypothetical protein Fur0037_25880 [Planctomycetota bacterium]
MPSAGAAVLPRGAVESRLGSTYSSLFLNGSGAGNSIALDGEYLRSGLMLRAGLGARLELGAELAFAHTSGGFLDDFVIDYHDFFGFPDQDRGLAPRNRWRVETWRQGQRAFATSSEALRVLDLPVHLTWNALEPGEGRIGLSLRAGLELPTGNPERGFGDGGLDPALGVLAEWRASPVALTAQAQHAFASTPEPSRRAGLSFADVTAVETGAEIPLLDGLAAHVQLQWETATLRRLEFSRAAKDHLLLWTGLRCGLAPGWATEFSVGEDLSAFVAPDFSIYWSLVFRPGQHL